MFICPQCAESIDGRPGNRSPRTCPFCGAELPSNLASSWVDVARVSNLAEAGFLTDELTGQGIDARVFQADEFSGLSGGWATAYLIRAPSSMAQQAAAQIRRHLADDSAEDDAVAPRFGFANESGPVDPTYWRPVAIIVLAGVASFVLGRHSAVPEAPRRESQDSLSAVVDAIGQPLVTESPPGQPRHRLFYDRRSRTWNLDTDRDGDGQFDSRRQFHASGAAW